MLLPPSLFSSSSHLFQFMRKGCASDERTKRRRKVHLAASRDETDAHHKASLSCCEWLRRDALPPVSILESRLQSVFVGPRTRLGQHSITFSCLQTIRSGGERARKKFNQRLSLSFGVSRSGPGPTDNLFPMLSMSPMQGIALNTLAIRLARGLPSPSQSAEYFITRPAHILRSPGLWRPRVVRYLIDGNKCDERDTI